MQIKKISKEQPEEKELIFRPESFQEFIGQKEIKKILETAINSSKKRNEPLGHILFSGESGYGKTTLAQITAKSLGVNIKIVTGYAISKPAEIISILNNLQTGDILFIDEIHRLKPTIEEILYIAMEDYAIDMVMPEGGNVRIPINKFTLMGATTKLESLSLPLKNRFVYKFHFTDYIEIEKQDIIKRYLNLYKINFDKNIISKISEKVISVPREINNFCIKLRDYLTSNSQNKNNLFITEQIWNEFQNWADLQKGGLSPVHKKYLEILEEFDGGPVGIKTISLKLGLNEKAVENDVEPLLLKLGSIEKTTKGRNLK